MTIPDDPLEDIALLWETLDDNPQHLVWNRPIGLLVSRSPTCIIRSDAAYEGLGGWCADPPFMWRLSDADLSAMGFDVKALRDGASEPLATTDGLHINVLEFLTLIVNIWLTQRLLNIGGPRVGGHIIQALAQTTHLHYLG